MRKPFIAHSWWLTPAIVELARTSSPTIFISSSSLPISTRTVRLMLLALRVASSAKGWVGVADSGGTSGVLEDGISGGSAATAGLFDSEGTGADRSSEFIPGPSCVTVTLSRSTAAFNSSRERLEPNRISKSILVSRCPPTLGKVLITSPHSFNISVTADNSVSNVVKSNDVWMVKIVRPLARLSFRRCSSYSVRAQST